MKKSLIAMLLAVVMCLMAGAPAVLAEDEERIVGLSIPTTWANVYVELRDQLEAALPEGVSLVLADAEVNPGNQVDQIQNFITQGIDVLVVVPMAAPLLVEPLQQAMDAGIRVVVCFNRTETDDFDAAVYVGDEFMVGATVASMAKEWVDATYPNAEAGSVDTAVITGGNTTDQLQRTFGMKIIAEPYLRQLNGDEWGDYILDAQGNQIENPLYCPQVNIVAEDPCEADVRTPVEFLQNTEISGYDVRLVLSYDGDQAFQASEFFTSRSDVDLSQYGIFAVEGSASNPEAVMSSASNGSVYRGYVVGNTAIIENTIEIVNRLLAGEEVSGVYLLPLQYTVAASDGTLEVREPDMSALQELDFIAD